MDFVAGLKNEVFRPIVTIMVPGTTALAPYLLIAGGYNPQLIYFWSFRSDAFLLFAAVAVIAAGIILNDIGTRIEMTWDARLDKDGQHMNEWYQYLASKVKDEVVGQRYLEWIVMRMKFELAFAPALIFMLIGLTWLNVLDHYWSWCAFGGLSILCAILISYILFESYSSACVASKARKQILKSLSS